MVRVDEDDTTLERFEVDALVILQIMKHCQQHVPHPVTGMLLGLDVGNTLQVTHCFGYVQKNQAEDDHYNRDNRAPQPAQTADDGEAYQLDMLRHLRQVNVDSNTVGWYQTTHLGQFFTESAIETQYLYQTQIPRSALLVYDPLQSAIGKPSFKAFRLTPEFMAKYGAAQEAGEKLREFNSNEMFREIPITIHSPLLVEAFLVDWAMSDPSSTTTQMEALNVENQAFLEKNVQLLITSLQDLADEQNKIMMFERQAQGKGNEKGKGKGFHRNMQPPRQLDTMILSQQIKNHCKQINGFASDSFGKLYLVSNKPAADKTK